MHPVRFVALARLVALALLLSAPFTGLNPARAQNATPVASPGAGETDPALYAAVLADQRDAIYAETAGRLSRYQIDATFRPRGDQPAMIAGRLDLAYYNGTGRDQESLYLRLYANDDEYAEGAQTIDNVNVDGAAVTPEYSVGDTVVEIALPEAVAPEETVDLSLSFTTTIPDAPRQSYGMFSHDARLGTYALAHWEPLLAGYDPLIGWVLDPPSTNGDPVFTNTALYEVTLIVPDELTVVTTGVETASEVAGEGLTRHKFVSGPARDFVMAIDDDWAMVSETVNGTTIRSWFSPDNRVLGETVLQDSVKAISLFNDLFGRYPYAEMDVVEVDLQNAAGVEFPQITYIEESLYDRNSGSWRDPDSLEFTLIHELAHQWWYGLVGNNQYQHAFIDEGLTNFVSTRYFGHYYGEENQERQVGRNLKYWYLSILFTGPGDQVVDQATDDFPSGIEYGATIYGKGALGFEAIYDTIGADAFYAGLQDYVDRFRFGVATPDDLRAAFERASGQDLTELWRHWFDAAEGTQDFTVDDLVELQQEFGG